MANLSQNNELKTAELPLSAFLVTKGHNLLRIERAGRRCIFVFKKDQVIADATEYLSGEALCHPGDFNIAVRQLKKKLDEALLAGGAG